MIRKSLNKYIKTNVPELGAVIDSTPDLILSKVMKPFATISYVSEVQELWDLHDDHRKDNIKLQLSLYADTFDNQLILKNKIMRVIESATTDLNLGSTAMLEPGIPLLGLFDKLTTTNYKTYSASQTLWATGYVPVVYKNGTVISPLGYTVDYTNGTITFPSAQATTDDIRADYMVGYVDFTIASIIDLPITDIANFTHKFNTFFTLDTFYYIRRKGQKLW